MYKSKPRLCYVFLVFFFFSPFLLIVIKSLSTRLVVISAIFSNAEIVLRHRSTSTRLHRIIIYKSQCDSLRPNFVIIGSLDLSGRLTFISGKTCLLKRSYEDASKTYAIKLFTIERLKKY